MTGSLAGRYLAAVNSGRPSAAAGGGNNGVKLTSSGMSVPSVRQTQKLLLLKTGQAAGTGLIIITDCSDTLVIPTVSTGRKLETWENWETLTTNIC